MKLTDKQKMLVWRWRNKMSQKQAAKHFGMKLHEYREVENNHAHITVDILRQTEPIKPTNREICKLLAIENNITQADIAIRLELSRQYVNMMENGKAPCFHLVHFWSGRGYKDLFNDNEKS